MFLLLSTSFPYLITFSQSLCLCLFSLHILFSSLPFISLIDTVDSAGLQAITALSPSGSLNIVIAVGTGGKLYVTSSALSVTPIWSMPVSPTLNDLFCVASYGPLVAFAAGKKSTIIMTRDGGNTWISLSANLQSGTSIGTSVVFAFHAISMLSPAVMYISGSNGAIIKTGKYNVVRYEKYFHS